MNAKILLQPGLVPHVKRDAGNRRVFDERDVAWIESLGCLKRCGLSIQEMRHYVQLCLQGEASIPNAKKFWPRSGRLWWSKSLNYRGLWLMWTRSRLFMRMS